MCSTIEPGMRSVCPDFTGLNDICMCVFLGNYDFLKLENDELRTILSTKNKIAWFVWRVFF